VPKIVVSYRRSDSAGITGRIFDRLIDHYGDDSVFMDIDNIPFGADFRTYIQSELARCDIVIAVIGLHWLGTTADGRVRIFENTDPIRIEVENARKLGIPIIPVLVDGATMPSDKELPGSLGDFAFINAAPIDSGRDFRPHIDRLIRSLDKILKGAGDGAISSNQIAPATADSPMPLQRITIPAATWLAVAGVLVIAAGGSAAFMMRGAVSTPTPTLVSNVKSFEQASVKASTLPTSERTPIANMPIQTAAAVPPDKQMNTASITSSPRPQSFQLPPPTNVYRVLPNVSGGVQNLRSGPAVTYPIVVAIPLGETGITVNGCRGSEDGTKPWCVAHWRGYSGYISSCCIVEERTGERPRME
jgi:hypothetical protein